MRSPWQVLGLQPGCSLEDVRAAYARELKRHRPDVDPAGFRVVRDAYEFLRQWVARAGAGAAPDAEADDGPDAEPFVDAAAAAPDVDDRGRALSEVAGDGDHAAAPAGDSRRPARRRRPAERFAATLARARARARHDEPAGAELRVLRAAVAVWRRCDPANAELSVALARELGDTASPLRGLVTPAEAVRGAASGDADLLLALLRAHLVSGDVEAARRLLAVVETACRQAMPLPLAAAAVAAAEIVALVDVELAERLVDLAFPGLDAQRRGNLWSLEMRLQAGKELARRSLPERLLFDRLLRHGADGASPADLEQALHQFARWYGAVPILAELFAQQFPAQREWLSRLGPAGAETIERRVEPRARPPVRDPLPEKRPNWVAIVIVAMLVQALIRLLIQLPRS